MTSFALTRPYERRYMLRLLSWDWLNNNWGTPAVNNKQKLYSMSLHLDGVHSSLVAKLLRQRKTNQDILQYCNKMGFSLGSLGLYAVTVFLPFIQGRDLRLSTPAPLCRDGKFYEDSVFDYLSCSHCLEQSHYSNCNVCCSGKLFLILIFIHIRYQSLPFIVNGFNQMSFKITIYS